MFVDKSIAPKAEEELLSTLPDINALSRRIFARRLTYVMAFDGYEFVPMCWVCLSDLGDMVQTAIAALINAKRNWIWAHDYYKEHTLTMAVGETRYDFDYAVMLIASASNHLAAAMWHLEEEVNEPMDRYDTTASVIRKWNARPNPPVSSNILSELVESSDWQTIVDYRHRWVHRGMPTLRGEFKYTRRQIWQQDDDPAPSHYLMKTQLKDGRVTYDTRNLIPDFEMSQLVEHATNALIALHNASNEFLNHFDNLLLDTGVWTFTEKGMSFTPGVARDNEGDGT